MAKLVRSHPIIEVRDGYVICGGPQRTAQLMIAPGTPPPEVGETHQFLRSIFHDGDYLRAQGASVEIGHAIDEYDDGSKKHRAIARDA